MSQADNFPQATRQFDGDDYYNMTDAALAAGYSQAGFRRMLRRLEEQVAQGELKEEELLPTYDLPGGGREIFFKKSELIEYFRPRRRKIKK